MCFKHMLAALCSAMVMGCAVGPNFTRPEAPTIQSYTSEKLAAQTVSSKVPAGSAQEFLFGKKIPEQWWTLFHSPGLDRLIRQGFAANPTVASAQAALRQARENLLAEFGNGLIPAVDANFSAERQQVSGASFGGALPGFTFDLYGASVSVSYMLDIFGGVRRQLEALRAQVNYQEYQAMGTYLTLTANIVTTAIQEASLRAQIKATQDIISDLKEQYRLVQRQFELGSISRTDVLSQQTQLAKTRATLPPLEKSLSQTRHQLAILVGRFPNEAKDLPVFDLAALELPTELPVTIPSDLVQQRPDIQASAALLHQASAQVGVATANLYPQITLTGGYGWQANKISDLFKSSAVMWDISAGLLQPIFRGGALRAQRRAAVAAYEQALAVYRQTVLQAFLNVADALRALDLDAQALKAQAVVESAARETLRLSKIQFKVGAINYITLLDAERQYQQARINLVQAQAARFTDTAALFQALGGGWWYPVPAEGPMTEQISMKGNHD